MRKTVSTFALMMLITGSIDSIRNLPSTALFGQALPFFFLLAALLFLLPSGWISAKFVIACPDDAGIFDWVGRAFGQRWGITAVWLQWIGTMAWLPTVLAFIAGTIVFLIDPTLTNNRVFMMSATIGSFWLVTLLALRGLNVSTVLASSCTVLGMILPFVVIVFCGIHWWLSGKPLAVHFPDFHSLVPKMHNSDYWSSLTAIITAFVGMELATVHARRLYNPVRRLPIALLSSVGLISITVLLGALAIAWVVPPNTLGLVDGVMQAFSIFFGGLSHPWLLSLMGLLLVIGSLGGLINWVISPAEGLLRASEKQFLPSWFAKTNRYGVPWRLLISQAIVVTVIAPIYLLLPSVSGTYWFLTAFSTELYLLMYVLMFLSAWKLSDLAFLEQHHRQYNPNKKRPKRRMLSNSKHSFSMRLAAIAGLLASTISLIVGFMPPSSINVGGTERYVIIFILGMLVLISPTFYFWWHRSRNSN